MLSTTALAAAVSAPQPSASKPASDHPVAIDPHRDAHDVATSSASRGTRVRVVTQGALTGGRVQMIGEGPH